MSPSPDSYWERLEDLRRYGLEPDPWYADDWPKRPGDVVSIFGTNYVADPSWGEGGDEEDGEA